MYVTVRSWKSSIMDLIGTELSEYSALYLQTVMFDFVYTLSSANIDQSAPNFGKIYMTIRSRMSSIMGVIAKMSLIMGQVIPDQSLLWNGTIELQ